ncbi:Uncharacterised protein [Yersinia enterocolitica]|nr:Uncharacterised protein [Yersinia enterocolitica]
MNKKLNTIIIFLIFTFILSGCSNNNVSNK